ncbi:NADH dehydrogenase (ubiquinone) Fe-S protein 6 [Cryptococcus deuterogattii 99/473]|uniref:NADH dehydrogenase (Ubiquinone) Fe-S protein 6 n=1 Tax=Cryptococcus deuterogattii Ram5 TaxID=1296110 RepID=A0A0D0V1C7_9TREE|nr:NADH dehydrogenase (ubiquinone) Fe-S protein 6 [Cryptococcus deuterogattii LA55]KIR35456.1 NADH dehydrogenase (ubiquinone) Fe-S protein 6 [Cryptococcus deuterogattii MMRL2647]KIR38725.1 NADH dehydrogenase (ubiquinone) Fe-S protein 6 [Cryptococcus deuterogattii Ram5]KIR90520.1 NADH dehydrogenase (ubiquinone) Fe-S protein 6 [Cryptococcus deuterogattii CBS 10090]KIY57736.1 NADH dehydrogenase (ubiquinone) Fe-S protein 6 [Cryptococcus deuterogattii 99/473]
MSLLRSARVLRLSRPVSLARSYATPPTPSTAPLPEKQPDASSPAYLQQSPNIPTTWSTSQNPKPHAYDNARFEQTAWEFQPNEPSAMGMVAEYPVRLVQGRKAACDGGGGALGHPKIFINLDPRFAATVVSASSKHTMRTTRLYHMEMFWDGCMGYCAYRKR